MVLGGNISTQPLLGSEERPRLSILQIMALTISFLGVQFGWAIQAAFTTPIFLELGLSSFYVSFVWLAGPISGLLVQPIVGVISDRSTSKWGRRRPFIFFGTVFIVVGMLFISNASDVGKKLGDTPNHNPIAITIAIIGFWILDLANNTVQGPCRALLVDVAPADQQTMGGSFFSGMLGLGNLAGYLTGSQDLISVFPFFKTNVRALFSIGMITLLICITITLIFTNEKPLKKEDIEMQEHRNPFVEIFWGIINMPKGMRRICLVQFFTWLAWFTYLLYMTSWVGISIFGGNPNSQDSNLVNLFDEGVRKASLGLAANAVITVIASLILPNLAKILGIKPLYFVGQLILAFCLLLTLWVKSQEGALILIAACGIPWAVVMIFPFTIVSLSVDERDAGKYMGVLNIFVVLPQICISIGIGWVIILFKGNLASALSFGGICSIFAAAFVWTLIIKKQESPYKRLSVSEDDNSTVSFEKSLLINQ